jgi:hypothetical protein
VLAKGTTFIRKGHVWFNLTVPTARRPYVVCVNFTTLDEDCPDDECLITESEYVWVDHPTSIAFSRAQLWDGRKIAECLMRGELRKPREGDVPTATVDKVYRAAILSRELSDDLRQHLLF